MKYGFIDLFCGCGGTSSGIEEIPNAFVFACVNHDKNAILSHKSNHPGALHFIEDIRTVSIQILIDKANEVRKQYPGIKICLWASLECTNHSNAKGGMSRDADSRTLAEHLFRYFPIGFDLIFIENVREFKAWGPLEHKHIDGIPQFVIKGKDKGRPVMIPIKHLKGIDYDKWVKAVESEGFKFEDTIINCADIGCPTTRKRLFIQFTKPGINVAWPKQTHAKEGKGGLAEWLAVGPLLNLNEHGESIFDKVRAPKTYSRVLKGVKKYGVPQFLTKYYGGGGGQYSSLDDPGPTLTTKDRCYLTSFMMSEYGDGRNSDLGSPSPSLTTVPKEKIVTAQFLATHFGQSIGTGLNEPAPSITTNPKQDLVSAHFLMDHQFNNEGTSLHDPCPTLIARQDKKPKYLVSAQYIMSTNFNNVGSSLNEPAPTLLASRKWDYLVSTDESGENKSIIHATDSPEAVELKMFMQDNGISDIKMRPLFLVEMLRIMTFTDDYVLVGTKTEKKKYIGNAVPPWAAQKIVQTSMMIN